MTIKMEASLRFVLVAALAVAASSAALVPYHPREKYKARGYLVSFRECMYSTNLFISFPLIKYIVCLGYTLQEHLEQVPGLRSVDINDFDIFGGYFAEDLSDDLLYRIRQDPGVEIIEDNSCGDFWI